jgi:tetratricopeptide (TPR) repeat protein
MPVLILGTYRDVELDVGRPLARALEELLRQRLAHRIALRRLPEAGVAAMLEALSGQEPPAPLVQAVYGETEGNPFFIEEVFQHLAEEGKLFDAQGRWHPGLRVSELNVPEGVRLVIGRRLERVCEDCQRVLTAAAVIGRGFSFELLEALGDVSADALLDAVDEAERAHLITSTADGPEARFTFAHELIRQTLVSGLSLPRRQRRHLRVAEAMERLYARTLEEHATDLAYHFYQAGAAADPEKTVRYLALAGERAFGAAAFEDALRHYDDALSLRPADDQRGRADLLYKRGQALRSLGRWEEALADWRQALAVYEELGDAQALARVCNQLCALLAYAARWDEAVELARRGLGALGQQVSVDRCRLLAATGSHLSLSGDYDTGAPLLTEALAMAEELGDRHLLGLVLLSKGLVHYWHMQMREAVESGLRAAELLRSVGSLWSLAEALWFTRNALLSLGRYEEAAEMAVEAEPLAERLGHLFALLLTRRAGGGADIALTGDINRFEEFVKADLELCRSAGIDWVSHSYTWLGGAYFWRGEWGQALESYEEGVRLEPPGPLAGFAWALLFLGKAYVGDGDSALAMLDDRMSSLLRPGRANTLGAWSMLFAAVEGLAVLGEREKAAKLYPLVLEAFDTGCPTRGAMYGLLQTVAGMAAAAGGHWEKAEEHYQTALRQAHELPVVIEQPEVRRWYARMLIDRDAPGDREKARELLTEAIGMYRRIGMPKHVEMAEALLARL